MKTLLPILGLLAFTTPAMAAPENGKPAPAFKLPGADGKSYGLEQFKGKTVVLEWKNHGCPFVKKHYESGNMPSLQAKYSKKGVVWLSIISSAEGKQGHSTPAEAKADVAKFKAAPKAVLLDPKGEVGRLYGAKTTPHMFVINPKGLLVYQGAIDDNDSSDADDIPTSKNYVAAALDSTLAGKPVAEAETTPYGCSVKYE